MVLCTSQWLHIFPMSYYQYLPHASSDHSPLLIHLLSNSENGFKPFRFFNYWQAHPEFKAVLLSAWGVCVCVRVRVMNYTEMDHNLCTTSSFEIKFVY